MKKNKVGLLCVAIILITCLLVDYNGAYAKAVWNLDIKSVGDESGVQGQTSIVAFEIENKSSESLELSNLKLDTTDGVSVENPSGKVTIPQNSKSTVSFNLEIDKTANAGKKNFVFKGEGKKGSDKKDFNIDFEFDIVEREGAPGSDHRDLTAFRISQKINPSTGFVIGSSNTMEVTVVNYGNTTLRDGKIIITLPEGLSVHNGSNTETVGYISMGSTKKAQFKISVQENTKSKTYPVEVEVNGVAGSDQRISTKKTFYIAVSGKSAVNSDNIKIKNMNAPSGVIAGKEFSVSFDVENSTNTDLKNTKISLELPEKIVNKSRNVFIETIKSKEKKTYNVKLFPKEGIEEKTYPLRIKVESLDDENALVSQYMTVNVSGNGEGSKKPQLMVDNYSYGNNPVEAGREFDINLSIKNTSNKTLSNIKVTLSSEGSTFVPVKGSNSFFVEKIGAKKNFGKAVKLKANAGTDEKTSAITVKMTYEDGSGNDYEAADMISIPVVQKTRLVVDEIIPPMEVYVGMSGSCELQFYNMGKTKLENLRVNCKGDFDTNETNSYYAGNMESGKSDSYTFNFIPREKGEMKGTITFTYENSNGIENTQEVDFKFQAQEMPIFEEENMGGQEELEKNQKIANKNKLVKIGIGILLVILIVTGIIIFMKKRKEKKMAAALQIEDDEMEV